MKVVLCFLFCLLGLTQAVYNTGAGCSTSASIVHRDGDGRWQDELGRINAAYDITLTVTGQCPVRYAGLTLSLPEGFSIIQTWNLEFETLFTMVKGFDGYLAPGQSFTGAGFVAAKNVTITGEPSVTVYGTACDEECILEHRDGSGEEEPCDDSTNPAPSEEYEEGDCSVTATIARDESVASWTDDQGRPASVYKVTLRNEGACAVTGAQLSFNLDGGEVVSSWNINSNNYVSGFGGSIAAGGSFDGVGMIIVNAGAALSASVTRSDCPGNCNF